MLGPNPPSALEQLQQDGKCTGQSLRGNREAGEVSPKPGNPRLTWVVPWDNWTGLWGGRGHGWTEPRAELGRTLSWVWL